MSEGENIDCYFLPLCISELAVSSHTLICFVWSNMWLCKNHSVLLATVQLVDLGEHG